MDDIEVVESVEVQPGETETELDTDAGMDYSTEGVEQTEDVLEDIPEVPVEAVVESSDAGSEVSDSVDSFRVEEVVDALLQSDRVTSLFQSLEDTLQTVADSIPQQVEPAETVPPVEVVSVEDVMERMTVQATETSTQTAASAPAASAPEPAVLMEAGGEVLVPGGEELVVGEVVVQLIQSLLEYFQEEDNDILTDIKSTVQNTEPHLLMDTPFADYTVTEGLLLVLVLWLAVLNPCIRMIKGGFSWLLY